MAKHYGKRNERICVVDEISMMDLEIADVLFDSIPNDSLATLCEGDKKNTSSTSGFSYQI